MPRLARPVYPGVPHHITQRGTRSQDIFFTEEDRHIYLRFVREAAEAYHTLRYILRNPVRAGMVRVPWRYEWSSAAYHTGQEKVDPLVSVDDAIEKMVRDWTTFLAEPDVDEYLCQIRKESAVGRPLGDERFITKLENKLKRNLKRGKPGRPKKRKRG